LDDYRLIVISTSSTVRGEKLRLQIKSYGVLRSSSIFAIKVQWRTAMFDHTSFHQGTADRFPLWAEHDRQLHRTTLDA